jgi:hypothetical protein
MAAMQTATMLPSERKSEEDYSWKNGFSGAPLDYSFKELKNVLEMETEEPRSGKTRRPQGEKDATAAGQADGGAADASAATGASAAATAGAPGAGDTSKGASGAGIAAANAATLGASGKASAGGATQLRPNAAPIVKRTVRKVTRAVKLNNNSIDSITDLPQALEFVMDNPLRNLEWIDLSFNQLHMIQAELLEFKHLKALYLHGNHIKSLPSVERLKKLPELISLTLNGNPIECFPFYRRFIVGALCHVRTLDHSTVTADEKSAAEEWFVGHQQRAKLRKERLEDEAAALNE